MGREYFSSYNETTEARPMKWHRPHSPTLSSALTYTSPLPPAHPTPTGVPHLFTLTMIVTITCSIWMWQAHCAGCYRPQSMLGKYVDNGTFRALICTALQYIHSCAVGRLTNSDDMRSVRALRSFRSNSPGHDTFRSTHDGLEMFTKLYSLYYKDYTHCRQFH